jgi:predicted ATPase
VYLTRGNLQMARAQGEHLLRVARRYQEPPLLLEAHRALGASLFLLGELPAAWTQLEQGIALYEAQQHHALLLRYGEDPGVACLVYAARVLLFRGYLDQALARMHQVLTLAQQCTHPFCLAFALTCAFTLHWFRRELQVVSAQVEATLALADQHAFPFFVATAKAFRGGVLAAHGQGDEGMAQIREGLTLYRATGTELFRPYLLAMLAEAYARCGRPDDGLQALAEALRLVETTGERVFAAEIYRLKGQLLLAGSTDHCPEAAACFQHARTIARRQHARLFELRAAMSLSRLWQQQGKRAQARRLLGEVYGWFTEGFDTGDLQEARTLLHELR